MAKVSVVPASQPLDRQEQNALRRLVATAPTMAPTPLARDELESLPSWDCETELPEATSLSPWTELAETAVIPGDESTSEEDVGGVRVVGGVE